jgi:hypothetical protein
MNRLLLILILTLSFQSWTKADDIKDFEIEGISIGDSLLNYISDSEIKKNKFFLKQSGNNKQYSKINLTELINIETFESLTATFKTSDNKYKLETIQGLIDFTNDINSCLKQRGEIIAELSEIFKNREKLDNGKTVHWADKNSYTYDYFIFFGSKSDWPIDHILVSCYDWSKTSGYTDHLRVAIVKENYMRWLEKLSTN